MKTQCCLSIASLILVGSWGTDVFAQAECAAGGNLRGVRVDGELMAFGTSIRAVVPAAAAEGQGGRGGGPGGQFSRDGGALIVTGSLTGGAGRGGGPGGGGRGRGGAPAAGARYRATYKDVAPGTVEAEIQITSTTNIPHARGLLCHRPAGRRLRRRLGSVARSRPRERKPRCLWPPPRPLSRTSTCAHRPKAYAWLLHGGRLSLASRRQWG